MRGAASKAVRDDRIQLEMQRSEEIPLEEPRALTMTSTFLKRNQLEPSFRNLLMLHGR